MKTTKSLLMLLMLSLILLLYPTSTQAAEENIIASGTCGEDVTWTLTNDGTLTISGEGTMYDYLYNPPWHTYNDDGSFTPNDQIQSIRVNDGVTSIGDCAFTHCVALESIEIADSVTRIGSNAFTYCINLKKIDIPEGVTEIGYRAFEYCRSLNSISLPASLMNIDGSAFWECVNLDSIEVDTNNPYFCNDENGVLFSADKTELVRVPGNIADGYIMPDHVTKIGAYALSQCWNLTAITIPDGVTSIDEYAFWYCKNLSTFNISGTVTTIGDSVFCYCNEPVNVFFKGDAPIMSTWYVEGTAYYPAGNDTWTSDVMQNCGANITWIEYEAPIEVSAANMKLGTTLDMNFFINKEDISRTDLYAKVTHYAEDDNTTITVPFAQWDERENYYVVTLEDLAARQMSDMIEITIYHDDGTQASSVWSDSPRDYAMRILEDQDAKTKTMLVDMLNYGAAAQLYWGYNMDDLANSLLTEEQRAYGSAETNCVDQRVAGTNYYGSTLLLKNRIHLTMYFQNITPDMHAVVSFTDHKGTIHETTVAGEDFTRYNNMIYGVTVDGLVVADGDQLVTVTVYDIHGTEVASAIDSINSYAARMMNDDGLFEAVAKFTASSYVYLH